MSEQYQHTISTEWLTTWRENFDEERTYTHVCPVCHYFYKDERADGQESCPKCGIELR